MDDKEAKRRRKVIEICLLDEDKMMMNEDRMRIWLLNKYELKSILLNINNLNGEANGKPYP